MHDSDPTGARDGNRIAYRPEEVAQRLGISRRHVYNLINGGKLPKVILGGRWMVLANDLDAFIENLKAGAAA